jgi:hypothetical protein
LQKSEKRAKLLFVAATAPIAGFASASRRHSSIPAVTRTLNITGLPDFSGVFRGRELTRKDHRLTCGVLPVDNLVGGGIIRGRVSEINGDAGSGKTSLATAFAANVTRRGEAAAWIDATDNFDPESMAASGVELARLLWTSCRHPNVSHRLRSPIMAAVNDATPNRDAGRIQAVAILKAAEWILAAGGFGLVVIDFGQWMPALPQSSALRLARAAERNGTAVLVLGAHRMCGTFAALNLALRRRRARFSLSDSGAPALFDGLVIEARVTRNKLGGSGAATTFSLLNTRYPDELREPFLPFDATPGSILARKPDQRTRIGEKSRAAVTA